MMIDNGARTITSKIILDKTFNPGVLEFQSPGSRKFGKNFQIPENILEIPGLGILASRRD